MNGLINLREQSYPYLEEAYLSLLKNIPRNDSSTPKMVLDVACGLGTVSKAIQEKGYTVWGIDSNASVAEKTARRISRVINVDLTEIARVKSEIGDQKFDYIIFSHILEHIYDPLLILEEYLAFLKSGGHILISVPNMAVWTNRIKLLFGKFEYGDTGLMDKTHIRFFTVKTAVDLVKATGCSIVRVDYTPCFVRAMLPIIKRIYRINQDVEGTGRRKLLDSPAYNWYLKYIYPLEYWLGYFLKSFFAYDIVILARK